MNRVVCPQPISLLVQAGGEQWRQEVSNKTDKNSGRGSDFGHRVGQINDRQCILWGGDGSGDGGGGHIFNECLWFISI